MPKSIVVSGGAGFIGSAVVRHLVLDHGTCVVVIDKMTYAANRSNLAPAEATGRCKLIEADICDLSKMTEIIAAEKPQQIMHLAAESHVDRSLSGPGEFIMPNVEVARAYWDTSSSVEKDGFRFLHVSTDEVYGSLSAEGLFHETTPYDPSSPYSASKAASDHLAKAWYRTYGFPVLVSNCSNNYGPYHFPEKLIPLVTLNALEG